MRWPATYITATNLPATVSLAPKVSIFLASKSGMRSLTAPAHFVGGKSANLALVKVEARPARSTPAARAEQRGGLGIRMRTFYLRDGPERNLDSRSRPRSANEERVVLVNGGLRLTPSA